MVLNHRGVKYSPRVVTEKPLFRLRHNKSLDASGGSVFCNLLGAAKGALIRAAASTQPFDGFLLMKTLALILMVSGIAFGQSKPCRPVRHAKLPAIVGLTYP